jgi:glyoxylase-like metal-dependent hydrolase (beta-lactamase superfamily II)
MGRPCDKTPRSQPRLATGERKKEKWMWVPTSATLIYGERDAVLVDAFLTVEQAHAAGEWIAASSKNLTTIYITHGHGDHFFGIGALLDRFPNAKAVATRNVLKVMRRQMSPEFVARFWNARYPGQIPNVCSDGERQ